MKKILYIVNVAKRINHFSESSMIAAKNAGFEFHIAGNYREYVNANEKEKDEQKLGIKIHQIDFHRNPLNLKNIKAYKQLNILFHMYNYDIVHCNTPVGGVVGRVCAKKNKIKRIIYEAHGFHFYKGAPKINWIIYYSIEKFLSRYTDLLITINSEDYKLAKNHFYSKKTQYVPGIGIDLEKFNPCIEKKLELRQGLKQDDFIILSVGELNKNKNHIAIIRELPKVKPNIHYFIVGEGLIKNELLEQAKKLNVATRVHFLGHRSDIQYYYKIADLFLLPSLREGLPMALLEAMACGCRCFASDIRGCRDLLDDMFLFNPDKPNLKSILEKEKQYKANKVDSFAMEKVIDIMKKIYMAY